MLQVYQLRPDHVVVLPSLLSELELSTMQCENAQKLGSAAVRRLEGRRPIGVSSELVPSSVKTKPLVELHSRARAPQRALATSSQWIGIPTLLSLSRGGVHRRKKHRFPTAGGRSNG